MCELRESAAVLRLSELSLYTCVRHWGQDRTTQPPCAQLYGAMSRRIKKLSSVPEVG